MDKHDYSRITPGVNALTKKLERNSHIDPELYSKYDVKRGLLRHHPGAVSSPG